MISVCGSRSIRWVVGLRRDFCLSYCFRPKLNVLPRANCYYRGVAPQSDSTLHNQLFNKDQSDIANAEIKFLNQFVEDLKFLNASPDDVRSLAQSIEQLEDLFMLVLIGEFNSGKSSFLNALLGYKYLEEGVTPTTNKINILRYGDQFKISPISNNLFSKYKSNFSDSLKNIQVSIPVPWLKEVSLVDTPGTNAVILEHEELTELFIPRSDAILFVTSCDRAFTESERIFLEKISKFDKKIVIVLSKIDLLQNNDELLQLLQFVTDQCKKFFGFEPRIFPVSARRAYYAKSRVPEGLDAVERLRFLNELSEWKQSGFGSLEEYVLKSLNAGERGKMKLLTPLGLASHYIKKCEKILQTNEDLFKEDINVFERIELELKMFGDDMKRDYGYQEERIDFLLNRIEQKAVDFLEVHVVLSNSLNLLDSKKLSTNFEKEVISDFVESIDNFINQMVDWMIEKQSNQWFRIIDYINMRQKMSQANSNGKIGSINTKYTSNRSFLISDLNSSTKKIITNFDQKGQVELISDQIKSALYSTLALEAGALGLGTILTFSLMDISGLLGVSALAVAGTVILPYRKRRLKCRLVEKIRKLKADLKDVLRDHFERELAKGIREFYECIVPYSRFIRAEITRSQNAKKVIAESNQKIEFLKDGIEKAFRKFGNV